MEKLVAERATELFSALSNPVRLRIVELLVEREMSVGEVASHIGIGISGASQHLSQLARAGVVVGQSRGATRIYHVRGPRIAQILTLIEEFCLTHNLYGRGIENGVAETNSGS